MIPRKLEDNPSCTLTHFTTHANLRSTVYLRTFHFVYAGNLWFIRSSLQCKTPHFPKHKYFPYTQHGMFYNTADSTVQRSLHKAAYFSFLIKNILHSYVFLINYFLLCVNALMFLILIPMLFKTHRNDSFLLLYVFLLNSQLSINYDFRLFALHLRIGSSVHAYVLHSLIS